MSRILFDLCGADDRRFSPYCWRTKMALGHKGLDFTTEPVRFTEKYKLEFSGQEKVPVLDDGGTVVHDSWNIAEYLEDTYSDAPALFPGPEGRLLAKQTNEWMDGLHRQLMTFIIFDVYQRLDVQDQAFFRPTREERYGGTLEELQAGRDQSIGDFRANGLAALRAHLLDREYICGKTPAYGDYIVFCSLQWARLTSEFDVLAPDDPVFSWRERMIARADEMGLSAPA